MTGRAARDAPRMVAGKGKDQKDLKDAKDQKDSGSGLFLFVL